MRYTTDMSLTFSQITDPSEIDILREKESHYSNLHIQYDEDTIKLLKEYVLRSDSLYTIVKDEEIFAGFCSTDSDWWEPNYFFLREIFIMPEYQGQGIGNTLMNESINHAKSQNAVGIVTETAFENTPMQKLCEKCGFTKWDNPEWKEGVTYKISF